MPLFTDQTGNTVEINSTPKRIISLVPSQTELLYDLGLDQHVVGITKFCVHPEAWFRKKTRIGGTKTLNMESIHHLEPDLVIANKEENVKEQVEELQKYYPVWVSDVNNLEDATDMIISLGRITGRIDRAAFMVDKIRVNFDNLMRSFPARTLSTAYLIWRDPYMAAGGDTFINSMMAYCGFKNVFEDISRYPVISIHQLQMARCGLLLLSSEPFPFKQKHVDELSATIPGTQIVLVDGQFFSWYGSRLVNAADYFAGLKASVVSRES